MWEAGNYRVSPLPLCFWVAWHLYVYACVHTCTFALASLLPWWWESLAMIPLLRSGHLVSAGGVTVLGEPTCYSDYIQNSTCEWYLDGPVDCRSQLHLSYWLDFENTENTE